MPVRLCCRSSGTASPASLRLSTISASRGDPPRMHILSVRLEGRRNDFNQRAARPDGARTFTQPLAQLAGDPTYRWDQGCGIAGHVAHREHDPGAIYIHDPDHDGVALPESRDSALHDRAHRAAIGQLARQLGVDARGRRFACHLERDAELILGNCRHDLGLVQRRAHQLARRHGQVGVSGRSVELRHNDPVLRDRPDLAPRPKDLGERLRGPPTDDDRNGGHHDDRRRDEPPLGASPGPGRADLGHGLQRDGRRQSIPELGGAGEPIRRELGQCSGERTLELLGNRRAQALDVAWRRVDVLVEHDLGRGSGERWLAAQHLEQDAAQAVDIGARVRGRSRHGLLGAHVPGCAHHDPGRRELLATRLADRPRDPEVQDHGLAAREQDVLGLDVAVDHPVPMGVVEGRRHLAGDLHGVLDGQLLFAFQPLAQRLALDVGHHVVEQLTGSVRIMERQDVGVLKLGGHLDLPQEALRTQRGGQLGMQDLDRHRPVMLEILGQVYGRHSPVAQLAFDPVTTGECYAHRFQAVGHGVWSPRRSASAAGYSRRVPRPGESGVWAADLVAPPAFVRYRCPTAGPQRLTRGWRRRAGGALLDHSGLVAFCPRSGGQVAAAAPTRSAQSGTRVRGAAVDHPTELRETSLRCHRVYANRRCGAVVAGGPVAHRPVSHKKGHSARTAVPMDGMKPAAGCAAAGAQTPLVDEIGILAFLKE